jgi:hypothetical protein
MIAAIAALLLLLTAITVVDNTSIGFSGTKGGGGGAGLWHRGPEKRNARSPNGVGGCYFSSRAARLYCSADRREGI